MESQPNDHRTWLVETKLGPPLLLEHTIPRPRLLELLHTSLATHPLTLLSAPAGYGKTTLLAALPVAYPDLPIAWLSLDEEDNDPVRFLAAIIAALQRLNPTCGSTARTLLAGPMASGNELRRVVSVLINDIVDTLPTSFALFLDDLHRITEPAIFVSLDYLLEHLPPQMHLVAATRVDPPLSIARLRGRGHLAELRLAALRFTEEEIEQFLNDRLALGLSQEELAVLERRTEGWAVGLRLLACSLTGIPSGRDRQTFIRHLNEIDRYIFDFLAEEVFHQQVLEVRTFLLETAVLSELTPTLCEAVTRRADAGAILDELYRRNVFLISLPVTRNPTTDQQPNELPPRPPSHQRAFRYHDLFAEFLQLKLKAERPEVVPELHLRAARALDDPIHSIVHYLEAASWQEAAERIEQVGAEMFIRGYIDTLTRWIRSLPVSVRESRPRLLHYLSNCAFWKGRWEEVLPLLERALEAFEATGDEAGQGEVLANLAICAVFQSKVKLGGDLFGRALTYPLPTPIRVQSHLGRALSRLVWGDLAQAEKDFHDAMNLLPRTGALDELHMLTLHFFDPALAFLPGGLNHLERICQQAKTQLGEEVSLSRLVVEEVTTALHLIKGQVDEAIRIGNHALALRERLGGHPFLSIDAALLLIVAYTIRGDYALAEPLFSMLPIGENANHKPTPDLVETLFFAGRARWLQGRYDEVQKIYDHMCSLEYLDREIPASRIFRTWIWCLLETGKGHYEEAERALRQPDVLEQRDIASGVVGNTRLMLARLYWQQNLQREALAELAPVLANCEKLGIPSPILVEGQSIVPMLKFAAEQGVHTNYTYSLLEVLAADDQPKSVTVPDTGQTLTPREIEVLRLVASGYSNRGIAEHLVISEWTVKSHLTKIYRKLDVASRTQAIGRARELSLQ